MTTTGSSGPGGSAPGRHGAHQSRYRESLGLDAGPPTNPAARARYDTVPHCLAEEHNGLPASAHGLNLMSPAARIYAHKRLETLRRVAGVAFEDRLWRNLLSSQPLAFSIVGELRQHPDAAAALFSELTGQAVRGFEVLTDGDYPDYTLDRLDAEWFPPPAAHTGDKSGFDIAALLLLADDARLLLTVEVKYTDTFSPAKLRPTHYAQHLEAVGLTPAAAEALVTAGCSQFLRSVLLTDSVRRGGVRGQPDGGTGVEHAVAVVLAREDDKTAKRVVDDVSNHKLPTRPGLWTHGEFFEAAGRQPALAEWAQRMSARYLLPTSTATP